MYLTAKLNNGIRYLYLVTSVYDKKAKRHTKKIVKNYGRYDKLDAKLRERFENAREKKKLEQELTRQTLEAELKAADSKIAAGQNALEEASLEHFNHAPSLAYGHLALKPLWEKDLGLRYKIDYLQKTQTGITQWRLNDLLFYLCSLKLISPVSYLAASENKSNFVYCPWNGIEQDNFYRGLDFVYEHREEILEHAVKSHQHVTKTEVKVAFFDCTNTWFETPYDDPTWQTIRFTRKIQDDLIKEGFSWPAVEKFLDSEEFAQMLAEELQAHKDDVLRMRGPSKEGRYAQPLVTVALAIDQTGFPIDCKVFAGNLSELKTIDPVLDSLKKKYQIKDIYFVADRGLNSVETLEKIRNEHLGFVVAQKVSRQKAEQRKEMLDLTGYRNYRINDEGGFLASDEKQELIQGGSRFKVCDYTKEAYIEDGTGELTKKGKLKRHKRQITCKIVYTFSPERRTRDLKDLETQITRAKKAVSEGTLMGNPFSSGWRALIQTQKEASQDKASKEKYRATGLKEDVIAERKLIAGYSALVFAHPENGTELTDEEVLTTYHRLIGIEECFRVMKSNFSIRPMYVRLRERITAHCYLCVLSLMLMKLLQEKLEASNIEMSSAKISDALAEALVVPIPSMSKDQIMFLNLELNPRYHTSQRIGKGRTKCRENDILDNELIWKSFECDRAKQSNNMDLMLKAVGLRPLALYSTLSELKIRLGLKSVPISSMLAVETMRYVEKIS